MRTPSILALLAIALSACTAPSATSGTGATPTPAELHPCGIVGTCTVDVVIPDDVVGPLQRSGMSFKVFDGCPRTLGFRDNSTGASPTFNDNLVSVRTNSSMRGAAAVAQSSNQTIVIPRLSGRYATVGIFFRSDPGKYVVVDFSGSADQSAKFGYTYNGRAIVDDVIVDGQNRNAERHMCP